MDQISVMNVETKDIAKMEDAKQVYTIWKQAEALTKLFVPDYEDWRANGDARSVVFRKRNQAMRRVGEMYLSLGKCTNSTFMTKPEFAKSLKLTPSEIKKVTSLAKLSQLDWENRMSKDADALWEGTAYGDAQEINRATQRKLKREAATARKAAVRGGPAPVPPEPVYDTSHVETVIYDPEPTEPNAAPAPSLYDLGQLKAHAYSIINFNDTALLKHAPSDIKNELFEALDELQGVCERLQNELRGI